MKFGEKPRDYSSPVHDKSKQPLKSVYQLLRVFTEILGCFKEKEVEGETYGFYLLTNSLLITAQSLKRAIQPNDYNLLGSLFRQSGELLFISRLIFDDFENTDLAKLRTKERLRQYATFCLWSRLRQIDIALNREQYTSNGCTITFSEKEIDDFMEFRSKEFHQIKDLIGSLRLNTEIAQLDKRKRNGENLYSFATVINSKYSSTSGYMRSTMPPVTVLSYSAMSSMIHGTWISIQPDPYKPEIIKSTLSIPDYNTSSDLIGNVRSNLATSGEHLFSSMYYLWPKLGIKPNTNFWKYNIY